MICRKMLSNANADFTHNNGCDANSELRLNAMWMDVRRCSVLNIMNIPNVDIYICYMMSDTYMCGSVCLHTCLSWEPWYRETTNQFWPMLIYICLCAKCMRRRRMTSVWKCLCISYDCKNILYGQCEGDATLGSNLLPTRSRSERDEILTAA